MQLFNNNNTYAHVCPAIHEVVTSCPSSVDYSYLELGELLHFTNKVHKV